jgi:alpha-D-ribose 1-methylphosphonate 5-triphosphate synthase subunit PhnG
VVAGTATATVGAVQGRQNRKAQEAAEQDAAQQAVADQQSQIDDLQAQLAQQQAAPPAAAPAAPPAAAGGDMMAKLQQLADMKAQGLLSDQEFADAKARVLSS